MPQRHEKKAPQSLTLLASRYIPQQEVRSIVNGKHPLFQDIIQFEQSLGGKPLSSHFHRKKSSFPDQKSKKQIRLANELIMFRHIIKKKDRYDPFPCFTFVRLFNPNTFRGHNLPLDFDNPINWTRMGQNVSYILDQVLRDPDVFTTKPSIIFVGADPNMQFWFIVNWFLKEKFYKLLVVYEGGHPVWARRLRVIAPISGSGLIGLDDTGRTVLNDFTKQSNLKCVSLMDTRS